MGKQRRQFEAGFKQQIFQEMGFPRSIRDLYSFPVLIQLDGSE